MAFTLGSVTIPGCAPSSQVQALAAAIISALTGQLPGNFGTFNIGSELPTPENRDKLWYRVDSDCNPMGWYLWTGAAWTRAIPLGSSVGAVEHYWDASLASLTPAEAKAAISFRDTGDAYPGAPSTTTHATPFWWLCDGTNTPQGDTTPDLMGRVIVGAGNGTSLTVRAQGATGGEETHVLAVAEIPAHTHDVHTGVGVGTPNLVSSGSNGSVTAEIAAAATATGGGLAHQNMPPFNCIYPVIRTSRTI